MGEGFNRDSALRRYPMQVRTREAPKVSLRVMTPVWQNFRNKWNASGTRSATSEMRSAFRAAVKAVRATRHSWYLGLRAHLLVRHPARRAQRRPSQKET